MYDTEVVMDLRMSDVIEHIFVKFSTRQFTIVDEEGYEDVIKYKWDEDGAEGFHETITNIKQSVPSEMITYIP